MGGHEFKEVQFLDQDPNYPGQSNRLLLQHLTFQKISQKCIHNILNNPTTDRQTKKPQQNLLRQGNNIITFRVVKRSSKIRSSIYKFEFEFRFLAFAIRSVIVLQGHAFNKLHNCIVRISNAWLRAITGGRRGEIRLHVIVTATVDSQRDGTRLVQMPNFFHPWTATDCLKECSRRVHWSVASGPWCSCHLRYFRLMFVSQKAVTPGSVCTTNAHSSHNFDGFYTRI